MIVICEECGKKYQIDPNKIKGARAKFKCKSCENVITITKPAPAVETPAPEPAPPPPPPPTPTPEPTIRAETQLPPIETEAPAEMEEPEEKAARRIGLGLRTKMIFFFFFIPLILIGAAGYLYWQQLDDLSGNLTRESEKAIRTIAEDMIATTARAAAAETKIYLSNHPNLMKEDFQNNKEFKTYAVQKVGKTGYTALYALPDEGGVWRTWAHVNPKIIGGDMKKMLAKKFPKFWGVFAGVKGGKESRGYYRWPDADGQVRDKFMVCTPLEGTPFIIAATTYLEEFTLPLQRMEVQALKQTKNTRNIVFAILGATILLIGIIVSLYGHALTGKIKSLTDVADRISVGELDAEIEVKSKDEIGELGDAISRMQDSIRLSIERLRRRR